MCAQSREASIARWLSRIDSSDLSAAQYLARHKVPFSLPQYYIYRRRFQEAGLEGLVDKRHYGNHRRLSSEAEGYLQGYLAANPGVDLKVLQETLRDRFGIDMTISGVSRCLKRLKIQRERPSTEPLSIYSAQAGFELIVALACHVGWPQRTGEVIQEALVKAERSGRFRPPGQPKDLRGRNAQGRLTGAYNRRRDVRHGRFASIDSKRSSKSLASMSLSKLSLETLARRCLAILSLPFVTQNGFTRSVDGALGIELKNYCGFHYKQSTLNHFLAELKYLGVSESLLRHQVGFWREVQGPQVQGSLPLLCYYVDGNTKALWSSKRVKKNKVSMLGRVMGCLEQVFVHDSYGRPIYFETYSGHAPVGEYVLSLFEKIENSLEGPGPALPVDRAIVVDGAGNSVKTLRSFAAQKKYHYITSLDDNQWHARKIRRQGRPQRYRYGAATLRDCEIELEDSQEKGYLFVTRAIKIHWDYGKETYLITSLAAPTIGASRVVKAYFDRWPDQELAFKIMKSVASLHRVAGYGKQEVPDPKVVDRQARLSQRMEELKAQLEKPRSELESLDVPMEKLVRKEQRLKAGSRIRKGRRILPKADREKLTAIGLEIARLERKRKAVQKAYPAFEQLEKAEREWLRLQGKETVYKVDVELDQIMTFFRVSLVNLYAYFARLMDVSHLSLAKLLSAVLFLPGRIVETENSKRIILERNKNDPSTMARLSKAISKMNDMKIKTLTGKTWSFAIE